MEPYMMAEESRKKKQEIRKKAKTTKRTHFDLFPPGLIRFGCKTPYRHLSSLSVLFAFFNKVYWM
jgi:hypothetical protein